VKPQRRDIRISLEIWKFDPENRPEEKKIRKNGEKNRKMKK